VVPQIKELQAEITARMRQGESFAVIEAEIVDPSGLPEPEKAALWLYGWSYVDWRRQRREAAAHIDALARGEQITSPPRPPRDAPRTVAELAWPPARR
jgi:hypothetical protein